MASQRSLRQRLHHWVDFFVAPLRGRTTPRPGDTSATIPVRVQVVDDGGRPSSEARPVPSQTSLPVPAEEQEWQFNQTIHLRKSGVSSSALIWAAVVFTIAGGAWILFAPLSEAIAVKGKLQPSRSVLRVDAPVAGLVEAVLVKEGERVRQGQPLLRFDLREPRTTLQAAMGVKRSLLNEIAINRAALGELAGGGLTANQQQQLLSQQKDLSSRREAASEDLRKSRERLQGLNATLATAEDVASRYRELQNTGAVSDVQVLESQNKVQELRSQRSVELREIARLEAVLQGTQASQSLELRKKIEENLSRITELDRDISQARLRIQYGLLRAPARGQVFDINVGPGSVVQQQQPDASKPIMKIVPDDALLAKVYLPNSAIGFVRVGQRADVSLDTFPASDYGRLPAVVQRIGSDALTPTELSQALGDTVQGLYFPAVLTLKSQSLQLPNRSIPLQAGMSLTADIQLRQRRVISIFTGYFSDRRRDLERLR